MVMATSICPKSRRWKRLSMRSFSLRGLSHRVEAALIVETRDLNHQRVAFPASD